MAIDKDQSDNETALMEEEVKEVIAEETFVTNQLTMVWLLLSVTVCLTYWLQKYRISKVFAPSIAAMVLGMFVGLIINSFESLSPPKFSPAAFLYGLLPPIVFSAGFSMEKRPFFQNFGSIVTFAVIGTVVSTLVFSLLTLLLMSMGAVDEAKLGMYPAIKIFLYGSLISAIDPVATLSVFSDVDAPPLLYNLVFGESVLNDAVAVVLFRTLQGLLGQKIRWWTIFYVAVKFCWISIGSLLVGVLVALACAFVLKNFNPNAEQSTNADGAHSDGTVYEMSIILMGAYLAYLLAEAVSLSGIVALFFSGIVHAHYAVHNISKDAHVAIKKVASVLGFLCEIFVFEYLGLQVALIPSASIDFGIIISGIPLCLLSRAANIFPLSYVVNRFRKHAIPRSVQVMQFMCGLRGAVAYALSEYLSKINPSDSVETGTLIIVVFSTIMFGGATGPLMRKLGLQGIHDQELRRRAGYHDGVELNADSRGEDVDAREASPLEAAWNKLDDSCLSWFFGGRMDQNSSEGGALLESSGERLDHRNSMNSRT